MPCDFTLSEGQTLAMRQREVQAALDRLKRALQAGQVKFVIGQSGAVAIAGWTPANRGGLSDVCAFRTLRAEGSWEFRQALAKAEAQSGRKVNELAVAAGVHSHDGGHSWDKGH
jgi:hypothetical protein